MQIKCKICNKIFKHFSELAKHIDSEHSSEEIWEKDQQKKECAIKNGFTIYYIWENDYLKNKQEIIKNYLKIV